MCVYVCVCWRGTVAVVLLGLQHMYWVYTVLPDMLDVLDVVPDVVPDILGSK